MISMRTLLIATLLLAAACSSETSQSVLPKPQAAASPSVELEPQDRDFLLHAAQGNNAESTIGSLVNSHALRPEVVSFGRMLVVDHTSANRVLAAIAASKHIALPTSLGEQQAGYDRVVSLKHDAFDREFMRVMIGDHQQAALLYRSEAENGIDPDLRRYAEETLPIIEAHLALAQSLARIARPRQEQTATAPEAERVVE